MDDIYAMELLRQNLSDALEREDTLKQTLQAAETEMQSLRRHAYEHKTRYQQLDDLLEAEEAKTNAERLARQEAEETTRQHRAEAAKLRTREMIANRHCEAAESEVIDLQRELPEERSAAVTTGNLSTRLREELRQAEANSMATYNMLNAAKTKICLLAQDLKLATNHISMLEHQASELEAIAQKERLRATEAENTLRITTSEIQTTELNLSNLFEKYTALEAEHSKYHSTASIPSPNPNTASKADETQSPTLSLQTTDPQPSAHSHNQIHPTDPAKAKETPSISPTSRTAAQGPPINPAQRETPRFPEPAILRPRLASATTCHVEVEIFKASGRIVPAATATDTKNLRRKFFWRLPGNVLRFLIRDAGRG